MVNLSWDARNVSSTHNFGLLAWHSGPLKIKFSSFGNHFHMFIHDIGIKSSNEITFIIFSHWMDGWMDMTLECWEIVAHSKQPSRPFLTFLGIFSILKKLCKFLFLFGNPNVWISPFEDYLVLFYFWSQNSCIKFSYH
jgi:hypothetical protein